MLAQFVTDFADQAVVLPVALIMELALLCARWRRGAVAWAAAILAVLLTMLLLKMAVAACGWRIGWHDLVSPSGHTATAAVVYGGLLALLFPPGRARPAIAALLGGAIALLFGLTRLALHVHTISDVLVGATVGLVGTLLMCWLAGPLPGPGRLRHLAALALLVMAIFHGQHLQAEAQIRTIAPTIWPLDRCAKPT